MAISTKRFWGWAALFGVLAASNIAQLFLGTGHILSSALMAAGFTGMALAALHNPGGFLAISWQQLKAPRKLGMRNVAGLVATTMIVVGTVAQWFKI